MINFIIIILGVFAPAIVLHEYAHGWAAYKLGDPTAKSMGRLTLNPIKHVDPVGSIVLPFGIVLLNSVTGMNLIPIGWAKPVPVNFFRLKNPKRDMALVGMAGPFINVVIAYIFSIIWAWNLIPVLNYYNITVWGTQISFVAFSILVNLGLAVFNMVPVPPLDGSRLVMGLLPNKLARQYATLEPYGLLIIILLLNFGLLRFVYPIVEVIAYLMGVEGVVK